MFIIGVITIIILLIIVSIAGFKYDVQDNEKKKTDSNA